MALYFVSMTQRRRLKSILSYLSSHREVAVDEACAIFEVSPATIRRDFNLLVQEQKVTKTWGGVKLPSEGGDSVSSAENRNTLFLAEKKRIAERAASLIQENDVIIIDGGTTTSELTPLIADMRIKVITNSVLIAHQIHHTGKGRGGAEVIMAGGLLYPSGALTVGPQAIKNLKEYYANVAFLSVGGISEIGATNSNILVVETERQMINQSEQVVMLADHSKFGKQDLVQLCSFDEIHTLITDDGLDAPDLVRLIKNEGTRVLLA